MYSNQNTVHCGYRKSCSVFFVDYPSL